MRVYQCEDTLEGVFTAIYNAYADHCDPTDTCLSLTDELFLFAEYVPVETDAEKARKVADTLRRRFGEEDYFQICLALAAEDTQRAQAVYHTVVHGIDARLTAGHLFDHLALEAVHKVFVLGRNANNEYMHMRGFLRFEELESGLLYAEMTPKNHLLTFLMPHFADRLPVENFMIYDKRRDIWGVHPAGQAWYLVRGEGLWQADVSEQTGNPERTGVSKRPDNLSEKERTCRELFRCFCEKLAIEERRNLALQRSMLPLRFRENMTEFR